MNDKDRANVILTLTVNVTLIESPDVADNNRSNNAVDSCCSNGSCYSSGIDFVTLVNECATFF